MNRCLLAALLLGATTAAVDARQAAPVLAEALVVVERGGGQHRALASGRLQHGGRLRHAFGQRRGQLVGKPVGRGELQAPRSRHQHGGERPAEGLVRSVRDRVERRRVREMLGQSGGDPVEAALHACLPHALLEARGVADGQ